MAGSEADKSPGMEGSAGGSDSPEVSASGNEPGTVDENATADTAKQGNGGASDEGTSTIPEHVELHQHHVSKILDEALEEAQEESELAASPRRFKHPMVLDLALGLGLLVAMGGFTIGLFKMYITHQAEQSITQHNYKAAIALLRDAPLPGLFTIPGSDPEELLSQALYLDAMEKLEVDGDIEGALKQLQQIKPGSRYFGLAQEIIEEHHEPAPVTLQGGTEHIETNPVAPKKPLLPELPEDGSR